MSFFIYENWQAGPHKVVIHHSSSGHCNEGTGRSRGTFDPKNGAWHGPYPSLENARRKSRQKRGASFKRNSLNECCASTADPIEVIAISEALERLKQEDQIGAELVKLRYFAGLSMEEAGKAMGFSRAAAYRHWDFAKAWLQCELADLIGS